MTECDECGNHGLKAAVVEGYAVEECTLCGAVHGDPKAMVAIADRRAARDRGIHPAVYPAVRLVESLPGVRVARADAGDPAAPAWPFVQLALTNAERGVATLDNIVRSLALSSVGEEIHWVLEAEFQNRLVFTLKPRFHRRPDEIGRDRVEAARRGLVRVCANLERDRRLSWWRHPE